MSFSSEINKEMEMIITIITKIIKMPCFLYSILNKNFELLEDIGSYSY